MTDDAVCVLGFASPLTFCYLESLQGCGADLRASAPLDPDAVGSPTARMDATLPETLPDLVQNSDRALIVSARLAAFLAEHVAQLEHFPLVIRSSRDQLVSDAYRIVHLLDPVDCIDLERAEPVWGLRRKEIVRMKDRTLPLRLDRIPRDRPLFYPVSFPRLRLIRREFGEQIISAGFSNVRLDSIEDALARL